MLSTKILNPTSETNTGEVDIFIDRHALFKSPLLNFSQDKF